MDHVSFITHCPYDVIMPHHWVCFCTGGHAVRGGTGTGHNAIRICAGGCGVHTGEEPDHA